MSEESGKLRELVLAAVDLMGRADRRGTVRVLGESMQPTLRPGQLLAVEFAPQRLARGDMLIFRQGDLMLVHRLLGPARPLAGRPRLRTRGDGTLALDPPVDLDRVIGRVVALADGAKWRTTRDRPARAYAWCLAWHDLFWAVVASVSQRVDRGLHGLRISWRSRPAVASVERWLLRRAHRAFFDRLHSAVPRPDVLGES
jgi:hypothetical protein